MKTMRYKVALLSLLSLPAMLLVATGGPAAAAPHTRSASTVTSSSLGSFKPTFTGPAATGCASPGCHLLSGPFLSPSIAGLPDQSASRQGTSPDRARAMPFLRPHVPAQSNNRSTIALPTVSCEPLRAGCDSISSFAGGALGVKGINAVDSA